MPPLKYATASASPVTSTSEQKLVGKKLADALVAVAVEQVLSELVSEIIVCREKYCSVIRPINRPTNMDMWAYGHWTILSSTATTVIEIRVYQKFRWVPRSRGNPVKMVSTTRSSSYYIISYVNLQCADEHIKIIRTTAHNTQSKMLTIKIACLNKYVLSCLRNSVYKSVSRSDGERLFHTKGSRRRKMCDRQAQFVSSLWWQPVGMRKSMEIAWQEQEGMKTQHFFIFHAEQANKPTQ